MESLRSAGGAEEARLDVFGWVLGEFVAPTATVLEAEEAEAESGRTDPEPPPAVVVLQRRVEGQQCDESHQPQDRPDRHSADAGDVERLNFSRDVGLLPDFDLLDRRPTAEGVRIADAICCAAATSSVGASARTIIHRVRVLPLGSLA